MAVFLKTKYKQTFYLIFIYFHQLYIFIPFDIKLFQNRVKKWSLISLFPLICKTRLFKPLYFKQIFTYISPVSHFHRYFLINENKTSFCIDIVIKDNS